MFGTFLRASLKVAFDFVLLSLFASGVYAVWNPSVFTVIFVRTIGTLLIILFAALFCVAACDIRLRVNSGDLNRLDSNPIEESRR